MSYRVVDGSTELNEAILNGQGSANQGRAPQ